MTILLPEKPPEPQSEESLPLEQKTHIIDVEAFPDLEALCLHFNNRFALGFDLLSIVPAQVAPKSAVVVAGQPERLLGFVCVFKKSKRPPIKEVGKNYLFRITPLGMKQAAALEREMKDHLQHRFAFVTAFTINSAVEHEGKRGIAELYIRIYRSEHGAFTDEDLKRIPA